MALVAEPPPRLHRVSVHLIATVLGRKTRSTAYSLFCITDATDHSSLFSGAPVLKISAFPYSNPRADEATAQRNDDHLME